MTRRGEYDEVRGTSRAPPFFWREIGKELEIDKKLTVLFEGADRLSEGGALQVLLLSLAHPPSQTGDEATEFIGIH